MGFELSDSVYRAYSDGEYANSLIANNPRYRDLFRLFHRRQSRFVGERGVTDKCFGQFRIDIISDTNAFTENPATVYVIVYRLDSAHDLS